MLDFCGPFEVFSVASEINNFVFFEVFMVAKTAKPLLVVNGLSVNPKYSFHKCTAYRFLFISRGEGTRQVIKGGATLMD